MKRFSATPSDLRSHAAFLLTVRQKQFSAGNAGTGWTRVHAGAPRNDPASRQGRTSTGLRAVEAVPAPTTPLQPVPGPRSIPETGPADSAEYKLEPAGFHLVGQEVESAWEGRWSPWRQLLCRLNGTFGFIRTPEVLSLDFPAAVHRS